MANATRKQNIMVVIVAVAIVVVSTFATLYATGVLFGGSSGDQKAYQNVTFTDAVLTCENRVKSSFGKRVRNLVTDNHSSRFDNAQFLYKIFLKVDVFDRFGDGVSSHYINCFVRSSNGSVKKYTVLDGEESTEESADDGTNMFGIKKKG